MSSNSSVETSALAGVVCNAILYGAHLVIFPICMFLLIRRHRNEKSVHWILACAIVTQFILSTIYISVQLWMTFQSFIRLQPSDSTLTTSNSPTQSIVAEPSPTWWLNSPSSTATATSVLIKATEPILSVSGWGSANQQWSPIAQYWLNTSAKIQIVSSTVCFANTIIGDGILIWRLYLVWEKRWIVCIPPIISLTASVICAALMIGIQSVSIYNIVDHLALSTWALSIGTQVIATFLIAMKLQSYAMGLQFDVDKTDILSRATESNDNPYKKLMWIILESGAIYSALALALLIFYSIRQLNAAVVLMGCVGQTAAIIPATIVILVCLPLSLRPTSSTFTCCSNTTNSDHRMAFASSDDQSMHSDDSEAARSRELH